MKPDDFIEYSELLEAAVKRADEQEVAWLRVCAWQDAWAVRLLL